MPLSLLWWLGLLPPESAGSVPQSLQHQLSEHKTAAGFLQHEGLYSLRQFMKFT